MNLTYEDCKELKDAGFPQEGDGNYILYEDDPEWSVNKEHPDGAYRPTLSELIKSCGEGFFVLQQGVNNHWVASIGESNHFLGDSPEQAVKNLWIALNK